MKDQEKQGKLLVAHICNKVRITKNAQLKKLRESEKKEGKEEIEKLIRMGVLMNCF